MIKKGYAYVCKLWKIERDNYTKQSIPPRFHGFLARTLYFALGAVFATLGYLLSENTIKIVEIKPLLIEKVKIVEICKVLPKKPVATVIKKCHHKK